MPLPILPSRISPSPTDLIRLYQRAQLHAARSLGQEDSLDCGIAIHNSDLPNVWDANRVFDVAVPPGKSPADVIAEVDHHFSSCGVRCARVTLNPSANAEYTDPLAAHLSSHGWQPEACGVMHLVGAKSTPIDALPGVTVIPARAAFGHYRRLAEESAERRDEPTLADAWILLLDDPHFDVLLALEDGKPIGTAGVLAVGDVGALEGVYVAKHHRRRGIGRMLVRRVLEICVRSQFRSVLLGVEAGNHAAESLYRGCGFETVGSFTTYRAPWTC